MSPSLTLGPLAPVASSVSLVELCKLASANPRDAVQQLLESNVLEPVATVSEMLERLLTVSETSQAELRSRRVSSTKRKATRQRNRRRVEAHNAEQKLLQRLQREEGLNVEAIKGLQPEALERAHRLFLKHGLLTESGRKRLRSGLGKRLLLAMQRGGLIEEQGVPSPAATPSAKRPKQSFDVLKFCERSECFGLLRALVEALGTLAREYDHSAIEVLDGFQQHNPQCNCATMLKPNVSLVLRL